MDIRDQKRHLEILMQSYEIYTDRDRMRGDMWRSRPIYHKFEMMREKTDRAEKALDRMDPAVVVEDEELVKEFIDSLLDNINFAVFAIRELEEGQRV
jgi:hypothetical protein